MNILNNQLNSIIMSNIHYKFQEELAYYKNMQEKNIVHNIQRRKNIENILSYLSNTSYIDIFAQSSSNFMFNQSMNAINNNQYKQPWCKLKKCQKENKFDEYLDSIKNTNEKEYELLKSTASEYVEQRKNNKKITYDEKKGIILNIDV